MWGIQLDRASEKPLKRQIYEEFRARILSGQLKAQNALPSTRELAKRLNVSRSTVSEAYAMLICEGFVTSHQGAPTRVTQGLYLEKPPSLPPRLHPSVKPERMADFRTGRPDLQKFPNYLWRRLLHKAAEELPPEAYGYTGAQGSPTLRAEISAWLMRNRGLVANPDDIFITAGATHALHILVDLLCPDEKKVLIEDPCHSGMLRTFQLKGCTVVPIPIDSMGLQTQYLPDENNASVVYVTPSHQFPLGGILPASRRATLVRFARQNDVYIIEDDYDSEFRYHGDPITPLYTMDPQRVVYVGTFSKALFPALRIGYVILPECLHKQWRDLRTHTDVQNPPFEQAALAEFLRSRKLDRHVQKMRRVYGQRRQILLDALKEAFGNGWIVYGDAAGLHVTIDFPGAHFDDAFEKRCLKNGITIAPLESHCIKKGRHLSKLLIGYGHLQPDEIKKGVQLLSNAMKEYDPSMKIYSMRQTNITP